MDKNYSELPILSEVLKKRKKNEKLMLLLMIPSLLLFAAVIFVCTAGKNYGIMPPVLMSLFCALMISSPIYSYFQVDKLVGKVMEKLNISSYDKMEHFLEKCRKLDDLIFLSDDSIIDFYKYNVIRIRSITEAISTASDTDTRNFVIELRVRGEGKINLCFKNSEERDKAYKIITSAIDFSNKMLLY